MSHVTTVRRCHSRHIRIIKRPCYTTGNRRFTVKLLFSINTEHIEWHIFGIKCQIKVILTHIAIRTKESGTDGSVKIINIIIAVCAGNLTG